MNESSKYANLLKYLEKHEVSKKPEPKKAPAKLPKEEQKPKDKERVKELTKKMMKETEVFSFVPSNVKKRYPTEGFNIRLFEEKLINKLIEEHKKLQSYERPYISVMEILSCLRSCYYYRKKYSIDLKKKFTFPFLYLKRKVGDAIHETIQDVYTFDEVEKTVISEKFYVKGRLDALSDVCVIDFKPTDSFKESVDMKHYDQGNIYALILNTDYGYNIKKVVIVYYLLNFKDMQIFNNNVDIDRGLGFLNLGKMLKEHLESGIVIDPIGATEKDCNYCPYINYCQKDGFKEIAPPKIKITEETKQKKSTEKPKKMVKKTKRKQFSYKDPQEGFLI